MAARSRRPGMRSISERSGVVIPGKRLDGLPGPQSVSKSPLTASGASKSSRGSIGPTHRDNSRTGVSATRAHPSYTTASASQLSIFTPRSRISPGAASPTMRVSPPRPATGRRRNSAWAMATQAASCPTASTTRQVEKPGSPAGMAKRPRARPPPPSAVDRYTKEKALKRSGIRRAQPGPKPARDDLAKRLRGEEPRDVRHPHRRAEAVGRDLTEILPQALQADLGQVALLLERRFREVPPRVLHNLTARDLHLEGPFEAEDDVQEIDRFRIETLNERHDESHLFDITAQRIRHDLGDLRIDRQDRLPGDFRCRHFRSLHLEAAIDVEDLAGDVIGKPGGEKPDGVSHLRRRAEPPQQNARFNLLTGAVEDGLRQVGFDDARGHGVHRDPARR